MWPTLISIGPIAIQSFGLMIFLGLFFGGFLFWKKGRDEGFSETELMDGWILSGLFGLAGGRIWQVLGNWSFYKESWYKMIFITKFPGISYEGFWLGAVASLLIYSYKKGWQVWQSLEAGVLAFLMVEIFGWWGSFLGGSNLGKATDFVWGVRFPGVDGARHPVQLMWVVGLWIVFKLVKKWEKEYRGFSWYQQGKSEANPGFLVGVYLVFLGGLKLALGFLDSPEIVRLGLEVSQWFGLSLLVLGILILLERSGRLKQSKRQPLVAKTIESSQKEVKKEKRKKKGFDFK